MHAFMHARTQARHAAQRAALEEEEQVIRDIMRYLGVLHDVKASAKSVAAGGRDSVKDGESGVSDPFATDKVLCLLHSTHAQSLYPHRMYVCLCLCLFVCVCI